MTDIVINLNTKGGVISLGLEILIGRCCYRVAEETMFLPCRELLPVRLTPDLTNNLLSEDIVKADFFVENGHHLVGLQTSA